MNQLVFKFPFKTKYYEQDFYVSNNNFSVYKLIESWPSWPDKWLNVFGASGSGKTHLSKNLEKKIKKIKLIDAKKINTKVEAYYSVVSMRTNNTSKKNDSFKQTEGFNRNSLQAIRCFY